MKTKRRGNYEYKQKAHDTRSENEMGGDPSTTILSVVGRYVDFIWSLTTVRILIKLYMKYCVRIPGLLQLLREDDGIYIPRSLKYCLRLSWVSLITSAGFYGSLASSSSLDTSFRKEHSRNNSFNRCLASEKAEGGLLSLPRSASLSTRDWGQLFDNNKARTSVITSDKSIFSAIESSTRSRPVERRALYTKTSSVQ